ncbi:helix-turn-helix transcriptional regulator [Microbacterium aurantiacum]|uniref:helix-turn-helix transcriptional regulator n=1 Tax=Microbacterium aurantiacum TaxID=162393 RepID=UPI0015E077D5|nr:LuxR family transcriptional regulator [Microbacterium aurantiacum]
MFIGRMAELTRLRSHLTDPDDSAHRVVLLEGPIGIGKTAVVNEFLRSGLSERVLFSRPAELATNIPLDGIRSIIEELLDEDLLLLLAEQRPTRVLLRSIRERLAADPTVIVIDDAHWLDAPARGILERLLSEPSSTALSFLFVFRTGAAPESLIRAATRGGSAVHRITLGPLDEADSATLLAAHGAQGKEYIELAAGNPLFLRLLAESGRGDDADDVSHQEIGDTLRGELLTLDEESRRLMQALSLTPPVAPETLGAIAGLGAQDIAEGADRLAQRGLIEAESLRVVHPFIRAAAYRSMTPRERRLAHRTAARNASDVLQQASHLQHLGSHLTSDELETVLEAAGIVLATSPQSCVAMLHRSRRIPHRARDLMLARALLIDGQPVEAEALLREVHSAQEPTGESFALLIQSLRIQSRPDEGIELVREARAMPLDPEVALELVTLEVMHDSDSDVASRTWLEQNDGDVPAHAAALAGLRALAFLREGDLTRARASYQAAKDGFSALSASEMLRVIDVTTAMGWCAHFLADFAVGAGFLERAIRLAETHGRFHVLPHLYLILGFISIPLDRCEEAEELIELAIDAAEKYNWPDAVPLALTASLVAAPGRVVPEEIVARYQRLAAAGLPQVGWWRRIVRLMRARAEILLGIPVDASELDLTDGDIFASQKHIGLGELALKRGDAAAALRHADAAIAWGVEAEHPSQAGHGTLFRAQVLVTLDRAEEALGEAQRAVELFDEAGALLYRRLARAWLAQVSDRVEMAGLRLDQLTPRERDVADLVADGHSNRSIAERLHLSPRTVESHVARILQKTGLRSRAGLARHLDAGRQTAPLEQTP